jgi:hypothetical protein
MTRRHFIALAQSARQSAERILNETELESDARYFRQRQWDLDTIALANVASSFNDAFDRGRFLIAAGYTHKPDGSFYR